MKNGFFKGEIGSLVILGVFTAIAIGVSVITSFLTSSQDIRQRAATDPYCTQQGDWCGPGTDPCCTGLSCASNMTCQPVVQPTQPVPSATPACPAGAQSKSACEQRGDPCRQKADGCWEPIPDQPSVKSCDALEWPATYDCGGVKANPTATPGLGGNVRCQTNRDCNVGYYCNADERCVLAGVSSPTPTTRPAVTVTTASSGQCYFGTSSCDLLGRKTATGCNSCPGVCCGEKIPQVCTPGSRSCVNASTVSTCKTDGSGYSQISCAAGSTCQAGNCVAQPTATPKVTVAASGQCYFGVSSCSSVNRYPSSGNCGCPSGAGVCCGDTIPESKKHCTPGVSICTDNIVRVCNAYGTGWLDTPCASGTSCVGNHCEAPLTAGQSCQQPHGQLIRDNKYCCDFKVKDGACIAAIDTGDSTPLPDGTWCFWTVFGKGSCANCSSGTTHQINGRDYCGPDTRNQTTIGSGSKCTDPDGCLCSTTNKVIDNGETCAKAPPPIFALCTPNQISCVGNSIATCNSTGTGLDFTACREDETCTSGNCVRDLTLADRCTDIYNRTGQYPTECRQAFIDEGITPPPFTSAALTANTIGALTAGGIEWAQKTGALINSIGVLPADQLIIAGIYQAVDAITLGGQSAATNSVQFAQQQCADSSVSDLECLAHGFGAIVNIGLAAGDLAGTMGVVRPISTATNTIPTSNQVNIYNLPGSTYIEDAVKLAPGESLAIFIEPQYMYDDLGIIGIAYANRIDQVPYRSIAQAVADANANPGQPMVVLSHGQPGRFYYLGQVDNGVQLGQDIASAGLRPNCLVIMGVCYAGVGGENSVAANVSAQLNGNLVMGGLNRVDISSTGTLSVQGFPDGQGWAFYQNGIRVK